MTGPSLRRNFAWAFLGSAVLAASQFAIQIAITKLAPSGIEGSRRVGDWTLANAITGPIFVFFFFKLRVVVTTDTRDEHAWPVYAGTRAWAMLAALAVTAGVLALRYREPVAWIVAGVALAKACEGGSDIIYGYLQRRDRLDRVARSQIARGAVAVLLGIGVLVATDSVAAVAWATAAVYAGGLLWDAWSTPDPTAMPRSDAAAIGRLLRQYGQLGLVTAIGSLQINIPRYFLEHHVSRSELGVFGMMQTLLMLGGLIINAMTNAVMARLARHVAADEWRPFARTLRTSILIGAALGVSAVLLAAGLGRPVLRMAFSEEFARHSGVLVWLAATSALLWMYLFLGTALDAMRSYRVQPWIHGTTAIVIAVACWRLVPGHGLYGATWSMMIGYAVECMMFVVVVALPLRAKLRAASRDDSV